MLPNTIRCHVSSIQEWHECTPILHLHAFVYLGKEKMEMAYIKKFFCLSHGVFVGSEDFYSFPVPPLSLVWEDLLQEVTGNKSPLASQLSLCVCVYVCLCVWGGGGGR